MPAGGRAAGAAGLDCACMRIGMMSPDVCWVGWASAGWDQIRGYGVCGKQVRAVRTGLTVRVCELVYAGPHRDSFLGEVYIYGKAWRGQMLALPPWPRHGQIGRFRLYVALKKS